MPVQDANIIETTGNCITYSQSETWTIEAVLQTNTGIGVESEFSRSGLINYESITSIESIGVLMTGRANTIVNESGALIMGATALAVGSDSTISNAGQIISTGSDAEAVTADASFDSVGTAVRAPSGGLHLANTGAVIGHVLSRTDADDEIHNAGSIFGDVMLGKGDDLYDGRGGLIHGVVQGMAGADAIVGGDHDETFDGGAGRDLIRAGRGDDAIDGGAGQDTLMGGAGADSFIFANPGKADRILDFSVGDDRVFLDNAAWAGLGGEGMLSASAFHLGGKATDADHRVLYNPGTGVLKHDSNGDADGGVTIIARLDPGLALDHHHFEIV